MTPPRAYLDWNASAPLLPAARDAMLSAIDLVGNPSSVHGEGRVLRAIVERARRQVARLVNARPDEVIFTSGSSEANATALGAAWPACVVSALEHDSVLSAKLAPSTSRRIIDASPSGVVEASTMAEALAAAIAATKAEGGGLVSLHLANNETGIVQPLAEVRDIVAAAGWRLHSDATQAVGRIPVDVVALGVDYMSFSSHKLGGPKGAGALVVRHGAPLSPLICGGGQERRMRAGTENVIAIAGFGAAAEAAMGRLDMWAALAARRDDLEREILTIAPGAVIVGAGAQRLPNTSLVALPGRRAETLVAMFDLAGVAVSAGAACASGKVAESHVLRAMGLAPDLASGAVRISLGPETRDEDLALLRAAFAAISQRPAKAA